MVHQIVQWIREFAQSTPEESAEPHKDAPVQRTPAHSRKASDDRRGPGMPSRLDTILTEVVERITNPSPDTLGALEVTASAPVAVKLSGTKAQVAVVITALSRYGVRAVPGASAEQGKVKVFATGEESDMLNWLLRIGVPARIIPVDLASKPAAERFPIAV